MNITMNHKHQRGTVMIVTLLLLIVMTLIVLSSSKNTTLQLRMASNMESRVQALQKAQSAIDNVIAKYDATDFTNDDIYICTDKKRINTKCIGAGTFASTNPNFPSQNITLDSTLLDTSSSTGTSWVEIQRLGDIQLPGLSADIGVVGASSKQLFGTVFYIISGYDNTAAGQGRAEIIMGALKFSR